MTAYFSCSQRAANLERSFVDFLATGKQLKAISCPQRSTERKGELFKLLISRFRKLRASNWLTWKMVTQTVDTDCIQGLRQIVSPRK